MPDKIYYQQNKEKYKKVSRQSFQKIKNDPEFKRKNKERMRKYYEKNRELINKKGKEYYNNIGKERRYIKGAYVLNYGITIEQYNEMLESQEGVCLICGNTETRTRGGRPT